MWQENIINIDLVVHQPLWTRKKFCFFSGRPVLKTTCASTGPVANVPSSTFTLTQELAELSLVHAG